MRFIPALFSHTGQIHEAFKVFVKEQIRLKFEAFEGEVKRSKVRSYMNWWIKCISAVIVKTASRNVAFKATRMRDSIMDGQDKFIMRESDNAEVGVREDCDEDLLDVGCNVDLYVANHESADLLYEEQVGDALFTSNESDHYISLVMLLLLLVTWLYTVVICDIHLYSLYHDLI